MTAPSDHRLFTPTFFLICGFNFTVFLSAFQLLPTAPIRILDLGGSSSVAGLFVGILTYCSALSAPFTGALADRLGLRRTLVLCSVVILLAAIGYALTERPSTMLALVAVHGLFWSGLLTSAGAYAMSLMPAARRAEGIGYWGMSTVLAVAVAPSLGLRIYQYGWVWVCVSCAVLNATMAIIASRLPPPKLAAPSAAALADAPWHEALEWRVAFASITMFLLAFGYGGVTSFVAVYARDHGVSPPGVYFTVLALVMLLTRPISGPLADRYGPTTVLIPCIVAAATGYALLAAEGARVWMYASAVLVGLGFGSAYPAHAAFVLKSVDGRRRAAALGGILAALDTGIGSGSMATGWLIAHRGYGAAFVTGAAVALLAVPYTWLVAPRIMEGHGTRRVPASDPSATQG
jgi:MFS family permease